MSRQPRSSDINAKPAVLEWFNKNPDSQKIFELVKNHLVSLYKCDTHGFINKKAYPEYRFNYVKNNETCITLKASQNHIRVRVWLEESSVDQNFKDYCKKLKNRDGSQSVDAVDFLVTAPNDLKILNDFLKEHPIDNFATPSDYSVNELDPNDNKPQVKIRLPTGKEVFVTYYHDLLMKHFIKWLKGNKGKSINTEYVMANSDRIDVKFKFNKNEIYAELKTTAGSSCKRAIREAIGQLLDYQYYDKGHHVDQLWIVLDSECSEEDMKYIDTLRKKHGIPLFLIYKKSNSFKAHPTI